MRQRLTEVAGSLSVTAQLVVTIEFRTEQFREMLFTHKDLRIRLSGENGFADYSLVKFHFPVGFFWLF
jgi:hypothetical protein